MTELNEQPASSHQQRLQNEVAYHTAIAQRELDTIARTPDELVERYRHCARWRTRYPECVFHFLTLHKPQHICDFGCGSGEMACLLGRLGYRVTGLDVSPDLVEVARERARLDGVAERVKFEVADAAAIRSEDEKFDAVLAMSIIHHLPLEDALDSLVDLLLPGGRVAFLEPVAYSSILQWFRDRAPVEKDVSPDERQLGKHDLKRIGDRFIIEEARHFYILARLRRVLPPWTDAPLRWLDRGLLAIPGMAHFAGIIALLVRRRD